MSVACLFQVIEHVDSKQQAQFIQNILNSHKSSVLGLLKTMNRTISLSNAVKATLLVMRSCARAGLCEDNQLPNIETFWHGSKYVVNIDNQANMNVFSAFLGTLSWNSSCVQELSYHGFSIPGYGHKSGPYIKSLMNIAINNGIAGIIRGKNIAWTDDNNNHIDGSGINMFVIKDLKTLNDSCLLERIWKVCKSLDIDIDSTNKKKDIPDNLLKNNIITVHKKLKKNNDKVSEYVLSLQCQVLSSEIDLFRCGISTLVDTDTPLTVTGSPTDIHLFEVNDAIQNLKSLSELDIEKMKKV